jgi:photosystem II stability/assembly factor-like uncharacterized protein
MNKRLPRLLTGLLLLAACTSRGAEPGTAVSLPPTAVRSWGPGQSRTLQAIQLAFWNAKDGLVVVQADCHTCDHRRVGLVLATRDQGESWDRVFRTNGVVRDLVTVGSRTALASIGGTLFRTRDGGQTWTPQGSTKNLSGIAFVSPSIGWGVRPASLDGNLVATTDGGRTWAVAVQPCHRSVRFDGPTGWQRAPVNFVSDVWFTSSSQGWVLCAGDGAGGSAPVAVLRTTDGGSTWTECQALWDVEPGGLQFLSSSIGWRWAFDDGVTERTTDGGRTWHRGRGSFAETGGPEDSIWFVSLQVGYALGSGDVWRTNSGGETWNVVSEVAPE